MNFTILPVEITSARDDYNVTEVFQRLAEVILARMEAVERAAHPMVFDPYPSDATGSKGSGGSGGGGLSSACNIQ